MRKSCCHILISVTSALGGTVVIPVIVYLVRWRHSQASSRPHWSGAL